MKKILKKVLVCLSVLSLTGCEYLEQLPNLDINVSEILGQIQLPGNNQQSQEPEHVSTSEEKEISKTEIEKEEPSSSEIGHKPSTEEHNKKDKILHGKGRPEEKLGKENDLYYDEDSKHVYHKNNGKWFNTYGIGGESLYYYGALGLKDKQDLVNAIASSFYSVNYSASISFVDDYGIMPDYTYGVTFKVEGEKGEVDSGGAKVYFLSDPNGHKVYYEGTYSIIEEINENYYCLVPFGLDNFVYTNYGVYQEDVGQLTAIIAKYIDKVYYDADTDLYRIDDINISHGELDTHYMTYPDDVTFSYSFKLTEDKQYIDVAYVDITKSNYVAFDGLLLKVDLFDINKTHVTLPK